MKPYNLEPKIYEIATQSINLISLGEEGRGRKQVLIPCDSLGESVGVKIEGNRPRIINDPSAPEGWLARIRTEAGYKRNAWGHVSAPSSVRLVAKGWGAYGLAGNCGIWDDVLLIAPIGGYVKVTPSRGSDYVLLFKEEQVYTLSPEEAELLGLDLENLTDL
jgi:hypothetical protein